MSGNYNPDEVQEKLLDCLASMENLAAWEALFIDDLDAQLTSTDTISKADLKLLDQVWAKVVSLG